jgi:hypothetical protein
MQTHEADMDKDSHQTRSKLEWAENSEGATWRKHNSQAYRSVKGRVCWLCRRKTSSVNRSIFSESSTMRVSA